MKLFYLLPFLSLTLYGLEKPTLEQLYNTDKIEISFSCYRDKRHVDMDSWLKIAVATDNLIDKCYTYPDEKDDELFEETFNTIRFIRNERRTNPSQGIHSLLYVAGQTTKTIEEISLDGHDYILTNAIDNAQIDQLLELCHQAWWAKERTAQELDTLLKNSIYFVLIDAETQNIIGFIRAVTDYVRFAGIFDVIVDEHYQGKGLGKLLVESMLQNPKLQNAALIGLYCKDDTVAFYEKCGFEKDFNTIVPMRKKK